MGKQTGKSSKKQQSNQKIVQQRKQHRIEFEKKMKELLCDLDLDSVARNLSTEIVDKIYASRPVGVETVYTGESNINPSRDIYLQKVFTHLLNSKLVVLPNGKYISSDDFLHYLFPLSFLFEYIFKNITIPPLLQPELEELEQTLEPLSDIFFEHIDKLTSSVSIWLLESSNEYLEFDMLNFRGKEMRNRPIYQALRIMPILKYNAVTIPTIKVSIHGKPRISTRLGISRDTRQLEWLSIPAKDLNLEGDQCFPVYIQNHALRRIEKRLSPLTFYECYTSTCYSIPTNHPIIRISSSNYLIPVLYQNTYKLGYYVATICDDIVLLRTFLFITSSITPEGRKFDQLTGLSKLDKNYLAIDKLSSIINIKIEDDAELMEIFRLSDMEHLTSEDLRKNVNIYTPESKLNDPSLLHDYINQYKQHVQESTIWQPEMEYTDNEIEMELTDSVIC